MYDVKVSLFNRCLSPYSDGQHHPHKFVVIQLKINPYYYRFNTVILTLEKDHAFRIVGSGSTPLFSLSANIAIMADSLLPLLVFPITLWPAYSTLCLCWLAGTAAADLIPESIEWFIENQTVLRSYDSAPRPHPSPLPPASYLSFLSLCVGGRAYWRDKGRVGGRGAKSYDREEAWPSINHSILSGKFEGQTKVRSTLLILFHDFLIVQYKAKNPGSTCEVSRVAKARERRELYNRFGFVFLACYVAMEYIHRFTVIVTIPTS